MPAVSWQSFECHCLEQDFPVAIAVAFFEQGLAHANVVLLLNIGEEMCFLSLDMHFSRQDNISYR